MLLDSISQGNRPALGRRRRHPRRDRHRPCRQSPAGAPPDDDAQIAKSLATMLRAGRTVVSRHQDSINDANLADKGFDSKTVLAEAINDLSEGVGRRSDVDRSEFPPRQADPHADGFDRRSDRCPSGDDQPQGRGLQRLHSGGVRPADQRVVRPPRRGPCRDEGHGAASSSSATPRRKRTNGRAGSSATSCCWRPGRRISPSRR